MDKATAVRLMDAARAVRANAYAPYSGFRVGAAVLAADGRIYAGVNVENRSYGVTLCAERAAAAAAVAAAAGEIKAVAVAADGPAPPCGACRQVLAELGPAAEVVWEDGAGGFVVRTVAELLPDPFSGPPPKV